jgi:putative transposase
MANSNEKKIDPALLDELLKNQDPQTVFSSEGLLGDLKKALAERMLDAEMDVHLGDEQEQAAGNHRNGRSPKRVLTDTGALPLSIPRDRHGRFEPKLIEKYKRRFPGFDEKIVALYARGMSTRDIQAHIRELYGLEISPDLVSAVTDAVHDEVSAWQSRPLESIYAIVFFDALRVKIRDEGAVRNKAVYLAIGVHQSSDMLRRECGNESSFFFSIRITIDRSRNPLRTHLLRTTEGEPLENCSPANLSASARSRSKSGWSAPSTMI